jgi:hypothetical protein
LALLPSSTQYWIQVHGAFTPVSSPLLSPQQFIEPERSRSRSREVENGTNTCSASAYLPLLRS